nr:FIG01122654: hypothetical protein [Kibdelosporangium sp. MJ126-NF4]
MDTNEAKRIETTNHERYQLATSSGWQFWADMPALLERWQVIPFNQRGDKRMAFGVVQGNYHTLPFTVFDFHRRPTVTSVHTRWTNKKVNEYDTISIDSVWVITLPSAMPFFQIVSSIDSAFDTDQYPEPPTPDRKFNRWYKLIDTDPNAAMQVLTPPVMSAMRQLKLHNWSLVGTDLVYVENPFFRTKTDDIIETLGKLASLVSVLPLNQPAAPPQPPAPPQQHQAQPQQYQQPQYQQPYPPQGYPQQPAPPQYPQHQQPYPAQPYPAQPYPQQPHPGQPYPAQPYPGQPYPQQQPPYGYPPQQGY